jgi:ATP/maltotriose-dependent transcriptional regulator MalT
MLYPSTLPNLDLLWSDKRPDLMELKLRGLIEPARISGIKSYYLQLQTQIARAQALQGKLDAASATLDEVEAELCDGVAAAQIRYYLERGRIQLLQNRPEAAEKLFHKAWRIAEASHHERYAREALHLFTRECRIAS